MTSRYTTCTTSFRSGETETSTLGSSLKSHNVAWMFHSSLSFLKEKPQVRNFDCAILCWEGFGVWEVSAADFLTRYNASLLGLAIAWGPIPLDWFLEFWQRKFGLPHDGRRPYCVLSQLCLFIMLYSFFCFSPWNVLCLHLNYFQCTNYSKDLYEHFPQSFFRIGSAQLL